MHFWPTFDQRWISALIYCNVLSYTLAQGNNLVDPNPMFDFYGLKPGDHWCLCLSRCEQARNDGLAPPVILESTHISTLRMIPLKILKCYDSRGS